MQHCVTDALRDGDEEKAEETYRNMMDLICKFAKQSPDGLFEKSRV